MMSYHHFATAAYAYGIVLNLDMKKANLHKATVDRIRVHETEGAGKFRNEKKLVARKITDLIN